MPGTAQENDPGDGGGGKDGDKNGVAGKRVEVRFQKILDSAEEEIDAQKESAGQSGFCNIAIKQEGQTEDEYGTGEIDPGQQERIAGMDIAKVLPIAMQHEEDWQQDDKERDGSQAFHWILFVIR